MRNARRINTLFCFCFEAVKKPQFTEFLKDTCVPEGKSVLLQCRFNGEPPPQIQWLRNDKQILPSAVYKVCISNILYRWLLKFFCSTLHS